jgi:deoxycytidylate deaminase
VSIKNNFLVIGFTGPLSSGCTTAAKLFQYNIKENFVKLFPGNIDEHIAIEYKNLKSSLNKSIVDEEDIHRIRVILQYILKMRAITKVLQRHDVPEFTYISMSNVLLKYVLECYHNNKESDIADKYSKVLPYIKDFDIDIAVINDINQKIKEKRFRSISKIECNYHDEYLLRIDNLLITLKKEFEADKLGSLLQDFGDNIRRVGNPFDATNKINKECVINIAVQANNLIKYYRNRQHGGKKNHFAIESFRNPYEVEYFRYRYYEFYLFSIYADEKLRQARHNFSDIRDKRDRGVFNKITEIYKQNVTRCVYLADIAVSNCSSINEMYVKLLQYYALIVSPGCITPSSHEMFMNQAYSLSLKSSCISRQVGAVIVNKHGYVVGAGWNDPGEGQIGCGYRNVGDLARLPNDILITNPIGKDQFREDLIRRKDYDYCFCYKDEYSKYDIYKSIIELMRIRKESLKKLGATKEILNKMEEMLTNDLKVKRLEYCRALHAEENALLQSAKVGGLGVTGGRIYTTSFPCELCAKKIYQTGITEVIYVEPYPNSISQDVFFKEGIRKVELIQFEGVRSHSFFRLYKSVMDKKEIQILEELLIDK